MERGLLLPLADGTRSLSSAAGPRHLSPLPISKLRRSGKTPTKFWEPLSPGTCTAITSSDVRVRIPPTPQGSVAQEGDTEAGGTRPHPPLPLDDNRQNAGSGLPSCRRTVQGGLVAPPPGGLCGGACCPAGNTRPSRATSHLQMFWPRLGGFLGAPQQMWLKAQLRRRWGMKDRLWNFLESPRQR